MRMLHKRFCPRHRAPPPFLLHTATPRTSRICLAFWPANTAGPAPARRGPPTAVALEANST